MISTFHSGNTGFSMRNPFLFSELLLPLMNKNIKGFKKQDGLQGYIHYIVHYKYRKEVKFVEFFFFNLHP